MVHFLSSLAQHFDERQQIFRGFVPSEQAGVEQQVALAAVTAVGAGDVLVPRMVEFVVVFDDFLGFFGVYVVCSG